MITMRELSKGATLAEDQGMTQEIGRGIAAAAGAEMEANHLDTAQRILEGLAVTNPHDPATWTMLAVIHRRRGRLLAARVCAETGYRLSPTDPQVRLVRAEVLLCTPDDRPRAREELRLLLGAGGEVGARARALLDALGA